MSTHGGASLGCCRSCVPASADEGLPPWSPPRLPCRFRIDGAGVAGAVSKGLPVGAPGALMVSKVWLKIEIEIKPGARRK